MGRYLVSGGTPADGESLPSFVVEVDGDELDIPLREEAQDMYKNGASAEEVAQKMGGKVVE